jgi:putative SOS response-associated peptidase YedK
MVIREADGVRVLQSMVWGLPAAPERHEAGLEIQAGQQHRRPVEAHVERTGTQAAARCLIPLTGFAEPAGPKGSKTRTWVTVKGQPIFAWGGLWRKSAEWGPVYSGAMADCNEAIRPLHDRMPVLLHPHEYEQWLRGSFEDLLAFQKRCFPDDLIEIQPTSELWVKKKVPASSEAPSLHCHLAILPNSITSWRFYA